MTGFETKNYLGAISHQKDIFIFGIKNTGNRLVHSKAALQDFLPLGEAVLALDL